MTTEEQTAFDELRAERDGLLARLATERDAAAQNAEVNLAQLKVMFEGKIATQESEIAELKK